MSFQLWADADDLPAAVETTKRFIDAGATHFVYYLRPPFPRGIAARIADEVIAKVKG